MIKTSTLQLLRFHFSLFLLPVFLFGLSQCPDLHTSHALLLFVVLHFLVYPASNGYNSYMDRDQSPIGGLRSPLQPTRQLFHLTILMDTAAVLLSLLVSPLLALGIMLYIIASRLYSWRRIRLKRYAVPGFLTVFVFQGAWIFFLTRYSCNAVPLAEVPWIPCLISSLLIGALYPLTQIYQHEEDRKDGVTTISYLLGFRGSFVFSMILFLSATALLFYFLKEQNQTNLFFVYLATTSPVVSFFLYWMVKVWKDETAANFTNSLRMNFISTLCTTLFFVTLIIVNH